MNREQELSNQLYVVTKNRDDWRFCCIVMMVAMGLQILMHFFG
jgi:hypothetical protein